MAYPTGSGSERMFRGTMGNLATSPTAFRFDGTSPTVGTDTYDVPDHSIVSILSIAWCDQSSSATSCHLYVISGGSNYWILEAQTIPSIGTFVLNDKIVLHPDDKLLTKTAGGGANLDVWYTYIIQDWS